jgi:hypothetical protein
MTLRAVNLILAILMLGWIVILSHHVALLYQGEVRMARLAIAQNQINAEIFKRLDAK